jgi:hypothetical protein
MCGAMKRNQLYDIPRKLSIRWRIKDIGKSKALKLSHSCSLVNDNIRRLTLLDTLELLMGHWWSSSFATFTSRTYDTVRWTQTAGRVNQNPAYAHSSRLILDYDTSPFCESQNQHWNLYLMTPFPSCPSFTKHTAEQRLFFQADQSITSC